MAAKKRKAGSKKKKTRKSPVEKKPEKDSGIKDWMLAHKILMYTFGLLPIISGLDKFFNVLTYWESYLAPFVTNIIPATTFMYISGMLEIFAGFLVFYRTRIGAYVVSAWLFLIAVNLILVGAYDIAVRDLVMSLSAFALAKMSMKRG